MAPAVAPAPPSATWRSASGVPRTAIPIGSASSPRIASIATRALTSDCTVFASSSSPLLRSRLRRNSSLLPGPNSAEEYRRTSIRPMDVPPGCTLFNGGSSATLGFSVAYWIRSDCLDSPASARMYHFNVVHPPAVRSVIVLEMLKPATEGFGQRFRSEAPLCQQ